MEKLRVPDPDEPTEPDTRSEVFILAAAVSLLGGLAFFLERYEQVRQPAPETTHAAAAAEVDGEGGSSSLERRAARLHEYTANGGLADYEWRSRDVLASLRHGPRPIAERACRASLRERPDELLTGDIRRELLGLVDRRAEHVPWSCLFRVYFTQPDRLGESITGELGQVWDRVRYFEGGSRVATVVARGFAAEGFVPEDAEFRRWVRLCALNFEVSEGYACRTLLSTVAPAQGTDLLDVVEVHLRETDLNPSFDLPMLTDGLQHLAERGQPPGWKIEETDALPDYDTDLRVGAIFYLCRLVNSPTDSVARDAAEALARVAGYGVRAGDEKLRRRWLSACRHAFGESNGSADDGSSDEQPSAPALAVWNGEEGASPDYPLGSTIERGDCRVRPDHPRWYCGSAKWNATSPDALSDYFVETRQMEWDEPAFELH